MPDLLTELDEHVLTITLNRPERRNAFSLDMIELWEEAIDRARTDQDVHVVVLTGAGEGFCAGGDFDMLKGRTDFKQDPDALESFVLRVGLAMEELDKPVIAAVNGAAVGAGVGMALQADLRFLSDRARLSEGYINVGIFAGDGDTHYLPRLVGTSTALDLLWSGDFVSADDALRLGLANRVFPHGELLARSYEYAHRLADRPQFVVRATKRAVYAAQRQTLRDAVGLIGAYSRIAGASPDRQRELDKFLASRQSAAKKKD